jgi:hypothetical protein
MVHVAQDCHHRRSRSKLVCRLGFEQALPERLFRLFCRYFFWFLGLLGQDRPNLEAQLAGHNLGCFVVNRLVDAGDDPVGHQLFDDVNGTHPQGASQIPNRQCLWKLDDFGR